MVVLLAKFCLSAILCNSEFFIETSFRRISSGSWKEIKEALKKFSQAERKYLPSISKASLLNWLGHHQSMISFWSQLGHIFWDTLIAHWFQLSLVILKYILYEIKTEPSEQFYLISFMKDSQSRRLHSDNNFMLRYAISAFWDESWYLCHSIFERFSTTAVIKHLQRVSECTKNVFCNIDL